MVGNMELPALVDRNTRESQPLILYKVCSLREDECITHSAVGVFVFSPISCPQRKLSPLTSSSGCLVIDASWPPSSGPILNCMLRSLTLQFTDIKGQKKKSFV